VLTLIWRADALTQVLATLERGFGSLVILPVHADVTSPAIRILVRAVKGGRAPTRLEPALVLSDMRAQPGPTVREILEGEGVLPLAIP
jgi:tRNA1(Val) A37 N6-methylase TrmN6